MARFLRIIRDAIRRERGDRRGIVSIVTGLAAIVAALGDPLRAARIWGATDSALGESGSALSPTERPHHDRRVAAARAALRDDAAFDRAWNEGRALTVDEAAELARVSTGRWITGAK